MLFICLAAQAAQEIQTLLASRTVKKEEDVDAAPEISTTAPIVPSTDAWGGAAPLQDGDW